MDQHHRLGRGEGQTTDSANEQAGSGNAEVNSPEEKSNAQTERQVVFQQCLLAASTRATALALATATFHRRHSHRAYEVGLHPFSSRLRCCVIIGLFVDSGLGGSRSRAVGRSSSRGGPYNREYFKYDVTHTPCLSFTVARVSEWARRAARVCECGSARHT